MIKARNQSSLPFLKPFLLRPVVDRKFIFGLLPISSPMPHHDIQQASSSSASSLVGSADTISQVTTITSNGSLRFFGQGYLSARALYCLGKVVLNRMGVLRRAVRMSEIQRHILLTAQSPLAVTSEIRELYDDLLELARPGMYKPAIQRKMVGILWAQIDSGDVHHLTEAVARWHDLETQLLIAFLFQDIRQVLAGSISIAPARDLRSKLGMTTVVRLIHFICEVIKVSGSKCRAILDAGLICLLHELPTYISYLQPHFYSTTVFEFEASLLHFISFPDDSSLLDRRCTVMIDTIEDAIGCKILDDLKRYQPLGSAVSTKAVSPFSHSQIRQLYHDLLALSRPSAVQKRIINVIWSQIDSGHFHDLVPAMRHRNTSEMRTFLSEFLNAKCMALLEAKSIAAAKPVLVSLVHLMQLITRLGRKKCNASIAGAFIPLLPEIRNELMSETAVHLKRVRGKNFQQVLYILSTEMFLMTIYRHDCGKPSDYSFLWSSTGHCEGKMTLGAPCFASFHISTCFVPVVLL
ncbi:hypothetical protein C8J56DRAFT_957329 [Mycena floridula]|nr:hypothetical protein C8J56DRAFT_957329 [Mycena floridula]